MNMTRRKNLRIQSENKKGSVLVLALFVVTLILGFGGALAYLTGHEGKMAEQQRTAAVAFHIAEAGVDAAMNDLREDFENDSTPSWADGDINGYTIGPDTSNYYSIPYISTTLNGGSYAVQLKNVSGNEHVWIRSVGTYKNVTQTLLVYVKMIDLSPWGNAIFAGAGAAGAMVNGNADIRGSVHILGSGLAATDYAVDLGGTAEIVGNNYNGLDATLLPKVPALPTVVYGGETISTLGAELRVKQGRIGLSGSSSVGESNVTGNTVKETVDGVFVTDGWGGTGGSSSVHSDNGTANAYDLGNAVSFPSLSDTSVDDPTKTFQQYFRDNALVLTTELSSLTPSTASFSYSSGANSITWDTTTNTMTISGRVYVDGGNDVAMNKAGSDKTISYTGSGSILVTGDVDINVNLITPGSSSFPSNIMGIMTPGSITFNEANINVMGLFYAENSIVSQKQTDVMGTFVSNYFDMGTNVPKIYQVPETVNHLPIGLIGTNGTHWFSIVSWQKI